MQKAFRLLMDLAHGNRSATVNSHFPLDEVRVEPDTVWQVYDERCPDLLGAYRRRGGGSSAPPFRRWLAIVDKPIVILGKDVEHKRARTFIGRVTICDLRGGRACARSIESVACTMCSRSLLR